MVDVTDYFFDSISEPKTGKYLLYYDNRVLIRENKLFWERSEVSHVFVAGNHHLLIDSIGDEKYLAVNLDADHSSSLQAELVSLRSLLFARVEQDFRFAGLGSQLLNWYLGHRFCGSCGSGTVPHAKERALVCSRCQACFYPRINPCVIVLVNRGADILLARNAKYPRGFYSCLAGFIEVGETPEETVAREVREEVGIEVRNIRYIKSQSWPFPSQLMLGFFADYASGQIELNDAEIEAADWFSIDSLPEVPKANISVAGELIELYRNAAR